MTTFTCPLCGKVSQNPNDAREGWCSRCVGYTRVPPPPGMVWVAFRGGHMDGAYRLLAENTLARGASYERALRDERYVYDEGVFRLARRKGSA